MSEHALGVEQIKELIAAMRQNQMGRLAIKDGDFSLEIESVKQEISVMSAGSVSYQTALPAPAEEAKAACGNVVSSPIVGTFYEAPGPDSQPFVRVGSTVKKGDVLFIIESMKLMNEVTSDFDGTVAEIHVCNAAGVEYGQPIMTIL